MRIVGIGLLAVILLVGGFFGCAFMTRNSIIAQDEQVTKSWANVEAAYQRRLDLIPNLVETVRGATKYEGETLVKITEGRNQILALAKEMRTALAEQNAPKVDELERTLMGTLRAYTGIAAEAYPNLKAVDQFTMLQAEVAGSENRVNVARRDYNDSVARLNTTVRQWGWMPIASGVAKTREPFKAAAGAAEAPKVDFGK